MTRLLLLPFYACLLPTLFACTYPMDEKHKATENIAHEEFLGSYALSVASLPGYDIEVIQEDGSLYVVFERQTPLKLVPISATRFRLEVAPLETVTFVPQENGDIDGFRFSQYFSTQHFRRLALLSAEIDDLYSAERSSLGESLYATPNDLNDGLTSRSISQIQANPDYLYRLLAGFQQGFFGNINSFLIMKDGELVVEQYFNGWSQEKPHQLRSVSKSVTSLLVGSAIDQGFIHSTEDTIGEYLPDYKQLLSGAKGDITIADLLTMAAGLSWDQPSDGDGSTVNINQLVEQSADSVAFVLSRSLVEQPGEVFNYRDAYTYVMGEILRNATGSKSAQAYIENSSLSQLDFGPTPWLRLADGRTATAYGLQLRPRDLAKIGQLMLNRGQWQGTELLSESWITESTSAQIATNSSRKPWPWQEYGYFWWGTDFEVDGHSYHADIADGFGGQFIVVIEALNLVVVSTAENFYFPHSRVMSDIMSRLVIPAFQQGEETSAVITPGLEINP